jgi:hypothetical protein
MYHTKIKVGILSYRGTKTTEQKEIIQSKEIKMSFFGKNDCKRLFDMLTIMMKAFKDTLNHEKNQMT